jgi:hypothetical protein
MRRPIFDTLRDVRGGLLLDDVAAQLQELVHAVQLTNKAGSLKLTLEVRPLKGSTEAVVVKDAIALKKPAIESGGTVMFPTPEGNLQRTNPNQGELPGLALAAGEPAAERKTA